MAILMDGHEITELELHASDGTTTTKQLTEELNLQQKTASVNGDVTPDAGYDGLSKVTVNVSGGGELPTLTDPATAADILDGKEAIDGNGAKLTGTCTYDADTSDADAIASDIAEGKTAYVNGVKITGTASSGGFDYLAYTRALHRLHSNETADGNLPENISITAPNVGEILSLIKSGASTTAQESTIHRSGCKNLSIATERTSVSLTSFLYADKGIETATITTAIGGYVILGQSALANCPALREFNAVIGSGYGNLNGGVISAIYKCGNLEELRFKPNSAKTNVNLKDGTATGSKFSDTTLVSLANALNADTAHTLSIHATAKAKFATITGAVSQVTEGEDDSAVTYDFFTADESGTTTLQDFVTATKGWTLS